MTSSIRVVTRERVPLASVLVFIKAKLRGEYDIFSQKSMPEI